MDFYTNHAEEIVPIAMNILFAKGYNTILPFRSIGLSVGTLEADTQPVQMDLFGQAKKREQLNQLHQAIDGIRSRFGERAIERGTSLANPVFNAIIPDRPRHHRLSLRHMSSRDESGLQKDFCQCVVRYQAGW